MSIILSSFPDLLTSMDRPVNYKVISTDGTIVRMKAQLKVDGSDFGQPTVQDPDIGTSSEFTFNFQDPCAAAMNGYLDNLPTIDSGVISTTADNDASIEVVFTELLTADLNTGTSITTSEGVVVITCIPQHEETQDITGVFALKTGVADDERRFLTNYSSNSPLNITNKKISILESEFTACYFNSNLAASYFTFDVFVDTMDSTGSVIQSAKFSISDLGSELQVDVPTGAANLNNATLTVGSQPLITSAVDTYSLQIKADNIRVISETLTYKLVDRCESDVRLAWVNESGGLDFFTFTGYSLEGLDVDRESFIGFLPAPLSVPDRGTTNIASDSFETYTIGAQALRKDERRWLKGLFDSTLVFWVTNGNYVPIDLTGDGYVTTARDPRFTLSFKKSNKRIRQKN